MSSRPPEDQSEYELWLNNSITQWFFETIMNKFDAHRRLLYSDPTELNNGELKGEQNVIKHFKNPEDLL